jgi:hypothetical protein
MKFVMIRRHCTFKYENKFYIIIISIWEFYYIVKYQDLLVNDCGRYESLDAEQLPLLDSERHALEERRIAEDFDAARI